ncbi:MAG: hypothetical protein IJM37_08920 [Lachnospiraceae bacterium]|nr:hypothetical protein [Lachnospiraceae bacterium]
MNEKYIVIGSGELAVRIAKLLITKVSELTVIEYKYSGKSMVERLCMAEKIPYKQLTKNEITNEIKSELETSKVKIVSAVNTYIFPAEIVENPNFYGINYHNALLPKHRGMNVESHTIFALDKESGITWHKIAEDIDTGMIACQKKILLANNMTSIRLLMLQSNLAYEGFAEIADDFINESVDFYNQQGDGEYHPINQAPNGGVMSLDMKDSKIHAFLRAMDYGIISPYGMPRINIAGQQYTYRSYSIEPADDKEPYFILDGREIRFKVDKSGYNYILKNVALIQK